MSIGRGGVSVRELAYALQRPGVLEAFARYRDVVRRFSALADRAPPCGREEDARDWELESTLLEEALPIRAELDRARSSLDVLAGRGFATSLRIARDRDLELAAREPEVLSAEKRRELLRRRETALVGTTREFQAWVREVGAELQVTAKVLSHALDEARLDVALEGEDEDFTIGWWDSGVEPDWDARKKLRAFLEERRTKQGARPAAREVEAQAPREEVTVARNEIYHCPCGETVEGRAIGAHKRHHGTGGKNEPAPSKSSRSVSAKPESPGAEGKLQAPIQVASALEREAKASIALDGQTQVSELPSTPASGHPDPRFCVCGHHADGHSSAGCAACACGSYRLSPSAERLAEEAFRTPTTAIAAAPARTTYVASPDLELQVLASVVGAMNQLQPHARKRIAVYLVSRFPELAAAPS